jgi:hypothetical protein
MTISNFIVINKTFLLSIIATDRISWRNSDQNFEISFYFCSFSFIISRKEVSFGPELDQSILYPLVKESLKTYVPEKSHKVFPSDLNQGVQKCSPIFTKFSAFLKLLNISILIKIFLEKPLFSQRKTQNTFSRKTSKLAFFHTFDQWFLIMAKPASRHSHMGRF